MADRPLDKPLGSSDPSTNAGPVVAEDTLLRAALCDVPLPAGLAARLKSHIRAQYQEQAATNDAPPEILSIRTASSLQQPVSEQSLPEQSASEQPIAQEQDSGWLRRSILIAAVAAGISGFAFLAREWTRPAEPTWLAAQCDAILVEIDKDNPANWQRVSQPIPASLQRVHAQLARVAFVAERPLTALGSKTDGTVYRLDDGRGRGIFLMRMESLPAVRGLTSRFEILPTPSGGWTLAAMTVGEETFVLAAACTEQQLFAYIRRPALT